MSGTMTGSDAAPDGAPSQPLQHPPRRGARSDAPPAVKSRW